MNHDRHDGGDQEVADTLGRPESHSASTGRSGNGRAGESGPETDMSHTEPEFDTKRGGPGGIGSREGYGNYDVGPGTASSTDTEIAPADSTEESTTVRRSDAEIQRAVEDCIRAIPTMDASRVNVEVVHGVVRLFGTVPSRRERWLVEDCGALAPDILSSRSELRIERIG